MGSSALQESYSTYRITTIEYYRFFGEVIVYWDHIGIMEKKMETTIVYWSYMRMMENKMDTARVNWGGRRSSMWGMNWMQLAEERAWDVGCPGIVIQTGWIQGLMGSSCFDDTCSLA